MQEKYVLGWEEWLALPQLNLPVIKAKIDTGAKISTLHAVDIEEIKVKRQAYVQFITYPFLNDFTIARQACVPIADKRSIISSNGIKEVRYVVQTDLQVGTRQVTIELSLTNRKQMQFPMLVGREAIKQCAIVDPSKSYCLGRKSIKEMKKYYNELKLINPR